MGVDTRQPPPLPAPTESMDDSTGAETEVATEFTTRTDKTSYTIPEDGRPITISTHKVSGGKEGGRPGHAREKSQTSLLIEYFEASKTGDRSKSRPSVRVKVTPSSNKRSNGHDAIRVTSFGKDRKPSYSRRISLGGSRTAETGAPPIESTEISHSSESNMSGRAPFEIEVMNNDSEVSGNGKSSHGLVHAPNESNVSSMPPDSMLDGSGFTESEVSRDVDPNEESTITDANYLKAPVRSRDRSTSRDRITQKVIEKLGQTGGRPRNLSYTSSDRGEQYDAESYPTKERRRRSSKSHRADAETVIGTEASLLSSNLSPSQVSQRSLRSGTSQGSRMTNNPKLLEMVEDTIKRMILPEINAIKEDQQGRRGSTSRDVHEESGLGRRISKSSSSLDISSKPKVVLNRDGDDPGTVLSRGDSEYKKKRRSSRGSHAEERPSSRRSSGRHSSHGYRDAAAAALAGGALTAAALKHHDSQSGIQGRKERTRTKSRSSRSRSASIAETNDEACGREGDIPPLPMASAIHDSDVTRESIVSSATERPESRASADVQTPVREVSRKSISEAMSPMSSQSPTRTPVSGNRGLGMSHGNHSIESPRSPHGGISTKARMAALAAAGLGAAAVSRDHNEHERHVDADGYGDHIAQRTLATASPAQSVTSLKKQFEDDPLVPHGLRTKSAASQSSAGRLREVRNSGTSLKSPRSSPTTQRLAQSRQQSQGLSGDEFTTPLERSNPELLRDSTPGTPIGESVDDWYQRQHELNNRYRDSMDESKATNRDSYQTNPFPEDDKRFTQYTDDSFDSTGLNAEQNVNKLGANPIFGTPTGAESHVASLIEPSTMSSNARSSQTQSSASKTNGSFADRLRELNKGETSAAVYEGSTLSQSMPSHDRWAAIKGHAVNLSANTSQDNIDSPRQSPAKSLNQETSADSAPPVMGATSLPLAGDPMPEIGHFDDTRSDISTNPSIIKGPLSGDATGKSTWPYTPEPQENQRDVRTIQSLHSGHSREEGLAAAAAGGAAVLAAKHNAKQSHVINEQDEGERAITPEFHVAGQGIDREVTPTSPPAFRDEGYVTDAHARSGGAHTPRAEQRYNKISLAQRDRTADGQAIGGDDPFEASTPVNKTPNKHARHISGNSHGMPSPLYDSSTGNGLEHIQSKDIVALMDHLTVRDAQRNARDTEILVTLVRSATEMRQSFDEMKRFIAEQDRMIMQNTDRNAAQTVQRVLGGPRPQPSGAPRTPRRDSDDEQTQEKRKGVLRRALKGLTGGKRSDDLARVEDMLMQILDNVEDLKQGGMTTSSRQPLSSDTSDTLESYEKLRAAPDSGYEPEGQAGTSSTPSQSGHFTGPPSVRPEERQFHSGYDGRRGSFNRVSTVLEGDEDERDELTPDEDYLLKHQFEDNQRMFTPTRELRQRDALSPTKTPPAAQVRSQELTPKAAEKQQKHKSNSSSIFGVPKISRWSKTTSSSAAPDPATLDSPQQSRSLRPRSLDSRSGSQLDDYDDGEYEVHEDNRLRSKGSLTRDPLARPLSDAEIRSMRSQGSKLTRTPSPLIPSEASARYDDDYARSPVQEDDGEFEDPKYQAVRNSLLLEHPQPRQGTTSRHQSNLEVKAHDYDDPPTSSDLSQRTVSDFDPAMWGSSGTAALARNRMSNTGQTMSSVGPIKDGKDDGPLIPQSPQKPMPRAYEPEPEQDWEPQYSNSGFSRGAYYTSPFGSGHLLEPIEEVRYSLETDSGHISPEPQLASAKAVDMRSSGRKITGPRPMGSRSPNPETQAKLVENSGTVRRKPVGGRSESNDSYMY